MNKMTLAISAIKQISNRECDGQYSGGKATLGAIVRERKSEEGKLGNQEKETSKHGGLMLATVRLRLAFQGWCSNGESVSELGKMRPEV